MRIHYENIKKSYLSHCLKLQTAASGYAFATDRLFLMTTKKLDLSGKRFGRLVGVKRLDSKKRGRYFWEFICDCGETIIATGSSVTCGKRSSCGCKKMDALLKRNTKHGYARRGNRAREYETWQHIKSRCYHKKCKEYRFYGLRGIAVCDRWTGDGGFITFLSDMGKKPSSKHSIERINSNGNYEPGNCVWALKEQQANNTRSNVFITYNGKTQTIAQWARELKIPYGTLRYRLTMANINIADAILEPVTNNNRKFKNKKLT